MDTVDLPSHVLSISATHLLHTLLITWLISLIHTCTSSERKEEEEETGDSALLWRPFTVNGLQQTVVEGLPCILLTATSKFYNMSVISVYSVIKSVIIDNYDACIF